jgi:ABC-type nitrate/sulfonate/bicarbonate transport system substrate-binding protein
MIAFALKLTAATSRAIALLAALIAVAPASEPATMRVNGFPNAKALPLHAGIAKGIFEQHGIKVELTLTENSRSQREGLGAGLYDIAHSALDNAVAMLEVARKDVVIVSGGDSGMNEFFVQADIASFAGMRGRILIVDAPDTAYALQAKKILLQHGLKERTDYTVKPVGAGTYRFRAMVESKENAGAILNLPFTVQAAELGMRSLGRTVDLLGPYQAVGAFVMRDWASANGPLLERYLAAYVTALRWTRDPVNKAEAIAILIETLKLSPGAAERTYNQLMDPGFGFTPDAKFDIAGFRNMLALRAEIQRKSPEDAVEPSRYLDLGYYERALQRLR